MSSIGEKIREIRIARNLTQKELGKVLGLNEEVIINYENNKRDEFYKKYSEKAIAEKRAKTINSQAALKELTEVLNEVLNDTNNLIKNVIGDINSNSKDIQSAINSVSKDVGYTLSDNFNKAINGGNLSKTFERKEDR